MLGKTNLTTIKGGTIVSDITEYRWNSAGASGIAGDFVKAVFGGGYLAGITSDGDIAYTSDGENWEKTRLDLDRYYNLYNIIYDGEHFILVGSVEAEADPNDSNSMAEHGIIVTSYDLTVFSIMEDNENYRSRYYAVFKKNGKYILIGTRVSAYSGTKKISCIFSKVGELDKWEKEKNLHNIDTSDENLEYVHINVGNNSRSILVYCRYKHVSNNNTNYSVVLSASTDGIEYVTIEEKHSDHNLYDKQLVSIFECKDLLYYNYNNQNFNYKLSKLINSQEIVVISQDKNFEFVDAIYFNKREIFINNHQMLILNSNESIADKTLDDLVDITYDFSMTAIIKAFDKLYIFGTGGNVLVSSDEVGNEETLAVKTMSAGKALYESKAYTDTKYAELEARIAILEEGNVEST